MRAHIGDWLVVPPVPHQAHGRRGQVVALVHPDGSPPYRVRWLDDDHVSLVVPPPDARLQYPVPAESRTRRHAGSGDDAC